MCCYVAKLIKLAALKNPTILVVTDRNDLDGQLYGTFCNTKELFGQEPIQAENRLELREALAARDVGGIIFTTVHKFTLSGDEERHPVLNSRDNIVVISDEAHRSQYGLNAQLDHKRGIYKYGYARHLRDAIPNATFIGFTGTPISLRDKDTRAVFGDYISIYDIKDAVDDEATVPIYYQPRLTRLDLNNDEIIKLKAEWHDDNPNKGAIKIIMTGSPSDAPHIFRHVYNKSTRKDLEKRFKDPSDPLKLVIVRDMWLTGFDVPCCTTMYVDKPMKGHNLMQAIARVNRVFKDKPSGLIVDYIGIFNNLKEAYKTYTDSSGKGQPTQDLDAAFTILKEKLDLIRTLFKKTPRSSGFDYSAYKTKAKELLVPAADYIIGLEDGKRRFFDLILALNIANSLDLGDETLKMIAKEITEKLRKSTTVDWQKRESIRASLRIIVRRTLQKYGYPPDKAEDAVSLILSQVEVLADVWSSD